MKSKKTTFFWALILIFLAGAAPVFAASTIYTSKSDFLSAAAGAGFSLLLEDFNSYTPHTPMIGVEFLPGVTASSNMSELKIWTDHSLAAFDYAVRMGGNAYYEFIFTQPYYAIGFDIVNWETDPPTESGGVDDGVISVGLPDVMDSFFCSLTQANYESGENPPPYFFGVISTSPITRINWFEPHEKSGVSEETSLDNFYVGRLGVPEPSLLVLLGGGLLGLLGISRKIR